jgi:hypothetical protein
MFQVSLALDVEEVRASEVGITVLVAAAQTGRADVDLDVGAGSSPIVIRPRTSLNRPRTSAMGPTPSTLLMYPQYRRD